MKPRWALLTAALGILVASFVLGCSREIIVSSETVFAPRNTTTTQAPPSSMDVKAEQAKALIGSTPDLVSLDVSSMYSEGHLPGAVNYYLGDGTLEAALSSLDKTVPYLVYCQGEAGSIPGAALLIESGFTKVYRLVGDYPGWVEAGYPVEK